MAQFYKILKADPLGEEWESHGKKNQTYWCQVEGEDLPVSISKQVGNTLSPGQHVYGDLMKAVSQKGTNYWKFKGAIVPDGVDRPADSPAQAQAQAQQAVGQFNDTIPMWFMPFGNMIMAIHKIVTGQDEDEPEVPAPSTGEVGEVDAETQKQLDIMLGKDGSAPKSEPEPEV